MMTEKQAEEIVRQVGAILAKNPFDEEHYMCWARPVTDLPCSLGKAKYAFFKYAESLASNNMILTTTDKWGKPKTDAMIIVYGMLSTLFREDAVEINEEIFAYIELCKTFFTEEEKVQTLNDLALNFGFEPNSMRPDTHNAEIEFNNFLADMQNNYHPNKMKDSDHPYLAYDGIVEDTEYHAVSRLAWDRYTKEYIAQKYGIED